MPESDDNDIQTLSYKPSAFYFREALELSQTRDEAVVIGRQAIRELEWMKEYMRKLGIIPPRRFILTSEYEDKALRLLPPVNSPSSSCPPLGELIRPDPEVWVKGVSPS